MRELHFSICITILFVFCSPIYGESQDLYRAVDRLSGIIPELNDQKKESLIVEKELTRFYYSNDEVTVNIPQAPFAESVKKQLDSIHPTIGVETVLLLPMPAHIRNIEDRDTLMLTLYNIMRRVSTIEGVEYYSASRGHMRIFFDQFYAVSGINDPERKEDPLVTTVPETDTITVFQQDLTFGKNYSTLIYKQEDRYISLSIKNLKTMWYGIIPLIGPKHMQIHLIVFPFDDYIVFYGNSGVKTNISLFGIEKSKTDSFYNRIMALFNWFSNQIASSDAFSNKNLTKQ